ncbi:hypothetical protein NQD34_015025, partial [Periophthalmus magnuspinnatus]
QVSLQLDSYNDGSFYHICGGTIVDSFYIMTAAHCILRNDIAILRLADPIYDNGHVAIANLPSPGATLPNNFECVITGWGLIDFSGSVPAILQEAPIPVVEHSVCSQPDWWGSLAKETMVCAGGDGIISGCQGDSGGPLNCFTDEAWRVYGVVSYGPAGMCNQLRKPTVFTRVASFMDWIDKLDIKYCALFRSNPQQYRAVVGEYNLDHYEGSEQLHRVEKIVVHPHWNGDLGLGNDIAILRLADPIYDNGHVAIANLPSPGATLPNNFECVITGWGLIDFSGSVPAILQEAPIHVVAHSVCSQPDWWDSFAKETMVCAGGDGIISGCQGDSGGPLNCFTDGAWRVYGVASFAPSGMCNQLQKPTVFTRVASFMDWIYSVMHN